MSIDSPIRLGIIEDDMPIQQLYKFRFEREGFAVQTASDGLAGLELARSFDPHLLLIDLRMPRMGGDEMLSRLRQTDWGKHVKVIILTNISKTEAPASLQFLNVDRYIVKAHHTPKQVTEIVYEVLGTVQN